MALNNKLAQKRLLIIGGSSGIGLATAQQATAAGAQTIVAGRSESKLRDAVASISGDVTAYPVDLTDDASVKSLFEKVGALDYLVLTGPAPTFGHFLKLDTEQVHQEFEGKFWGQYRAVKYAAPRLEKTGAIVLMSGAYSARPVPGATSLAAVQAGIEGLARGLAIDLAPIRVNVISPGLTDTPIYSQCFL
ncbi:MAG: SDR family oxidoreductase [Synechococcales cyanobacterium RU_4_20]|nr:SDR family oxidoreductase [Synechococcales cyanobacterium RU_4_20]